MIKREARILGLAAHVAKQKHILVIGAVYRGSLWLDAIITCDLPPSERLQGLIEAIVRSKQYSQIQAVILRSEDTALGTPIDVSDFSRRLDLPVISIMRRIVHRNFSSNTPMIMRLTEHFDLKVSGGLVHVKAAGLNRREAQEIFEVACAKGQHIPEAVRVAEIIAKHSKKLVYDTSLRRIEELDRPFNGAKAKQRLNGTL